MTLALFFWIVFLLWILCFGGARWGGNPFFGQGQDLLLIVMIATLGYHAFGSFLK